MALWLSWRDRGGPEADGRELLDAHPDLGEHLRALLGVDEPQLASSATADEATAGAGDGPDGARDGAGAGGREPVRLGDYVVLRELGRGGMGVVYEAREVALDRPVALKVLTAHLTLQPSAVARFKREALAAARLDHRGIVKVLGVGSDGDTHWFAMERIDGPTLATARPASLREAVAIGAAIADALAHAHAHGVLHRDVKPSNVLLRPDGEPVLTDFGLAREESLPSLTRTGAFVGTPFYASPEQAQGLDVDARSDVFSLGATLYELCTGTLPFDADDPQRVMEKIVRQEPADPSRLSPAIDRDLSAILLRALEKPPARRYPSAAAMARDLRAWLAGEPVEARRPSSIGRAWRWARREPARAGLVAALILGVPAIAALVGYQIANAPAVAAGVAEQRRRAVDQALSDGFLAWTDEDGDTAREAFARALALDPSSAEARFGTAMAWMTDGRADVALAELDAAPAPNEAFTRVRAWVARLRDDAALAERLEREVSEPKDALAHFAAGALLFERGRADEDRDLMRAALHHLSHAVLSSPTPRPAFHFQLAKCADYLGDGPIEHAAVEAMQRLWPDDPATKRQVHLRILDEDPARAVELARAALAERQGDSPFARRRACYDLGYALQRAKDDRGALAAYREAIAIDPHHAPAHVNLGLTYERLGEREQAIAAWRAGLVLHPKDHKLHANLGRLLRSGGDQAGAIAAYEAAVAAKPDYAIGWYNLGNVLAFQRERERAVEAFRHAVRARPDYARAHANLGQLLTWMERDAEAEPHLREAVRLLPSDPTPRRLLADLLGRRGDHGGAREQLEVAVRVSPRSADAWTALAAQLVREDAPVDVRDPAFARVAARQACALSGERQPHPLLVLAAAQLGCGDTAAAAASLAKAEPMLAEERHASLREYAAELRRRVESGAAASGGNR